MTAAPDQPVRSEDRIALLDLIRGLAVLMIFAVNVKAMAGPFQGYMNPAAWSGPFDQALFALTSVVVEFKFITIFSALFGAGLALVAEKADAAGTKGRLRARLSVLLVFGLIHGFLIWFGDILTLYALSGFLAALLIRKPVKTLWRWAVGLLALGWILSAFNATALFDPDATEQVRGFIWDYDGEKALKETAALAAGGLEQSLARAQGFAMSFGFMLFLAPRTIALMLIGAALYKSGFLQGRWSAGGYAKAAAVGLVLGLGAETARVLWLGALGWPFVETAMIAPIGQYASSLFAAFGYAGLIGWAAKSGFAPPPLAAAGRMAFTNYIACSVIGTTVFYGHGLGLIGTFTLAQCLALVVATWVAILIWSPLWLSRFRFGPLEWLWRSLTYGRAQPMRRAG